MSAACSHLLKELKIDDNTLVMLAGDNGSSWAPKSELGKHFDQASQWPAWLQARHCMKARCVRPRIARWPGQVPAGRVCDQPWAFWDFMPTAAELAQVKPLPLRMSKTDGLSIVPLLKGGDAPEARVLLLGTPRRRQTMQAVRFGDWKAVKNGPNAQTELYDLKTDASEQHNLATEKPDVLAKAESLLKSERTEDPNWPMRTAGKGKKGKAK